MSTIADTRGSGGVVPRLVVCPEAMASEVKPPQECPLTAIREASTMPANGSAGSAFAASTVFNVAVTSGGRLFAFASSEVSTPPVMRSKAVLPVWFGATTTYP